MRDVRIDVRIKLMQGLTRARERAEYYGASVPNKWGYETKRARHFIYVNDEDREIHFNTIGYNGNRSHTTIHF